ncbi:MAG: hypothetical protein HKN96_07485 [Flavobacteriaceae bacterium]|nr:hypothetical protein [Bacteroidia bacterium]NND11036.1 hypothetical protein [Flavobacteriaceae bacterium]NNL60572.1 hypothetical protein [Flavobacteriaceae bacterium]
MKSIYILLLLLVFSSCNYFDVKKTSTEDILQEELQTFNWNEVDDYPSFEACDSSASKVDKKQCFANIVTKHITNHLENQKFVVSNDVSDTLQLTIVITEDGKASIKKIIAKDETLEELPNLTEALYNCTDSLPKIFPAIKRGQQVNTQFTLPVVISVN